jgi:hypothetical protein
MTHATPNLDEVLAHPQTCGLGHFTLAAVELSKLKSKIEQLERSDAQRRAMRVELECCASTFAAMTGSGPAHAQRIRRVLKADTFDRGVEPAELGAARPDANGEPR